MKHFFISALGLAAFFASFTGIYAGGARAEGAGMEDRDIRMMGLMGSLFEVFKSDDCFVAQSRLEIISVKENLRGCFHEDESFIPLKKLWSESCQEVIGGAKDSGVLPYSFVKGAIAEDGELKGDKKLQPLLESVYGESAVNEANRRAEFIKNDFIPQLKSCNYGTEIKALSCDSLIAAAEDEGFSCFQLSGAIESAVIELKAERKVSAAGKAAPAAEEARQTAKP